MAKRKIKNTALIILIGISLFIIGMFVGLERSDKSHFKTSFPLSYCTGFTECADDKYYKCVDDVSKWDLEKMYESQNK